MADKIQDTTTQLPYLTQGHLSQEVKNAARRAAQDALKRGEIEYQRCEECDLFVTEMHHDDYTKPLEVRFLCTPHHAMLHRKEKPLRPIRPVSKKAYPVVHCAVCGKELPKRHASGGRPAIYCQDPQERRSPCAELGVIVFRIVRLLEEIGIRKGHIGSALKGHSATFRLLANITRDYSKQPRIKGRYVKEANERIEKLEGMVRLVAESMPRRKGRRAKR